MSFVHKGVDIQHTYHIVLFFTVKALDEYQQMTMDIFESNLNVF